jgi:transcriptional regulator with XRE-family HTH domain
MSKNLERLGAEIKVALGNRSQSWLADQTGVNQPTISRIVNARYDAPNPKYISLISKALKLDKDKLLTLAGYPTVQNQGNRLGRHSSVEYIAMRLDEVGAIAPDLLEYAIDVIAPAVDTFYDMAKESAKVQKKQM